MQLCYGTRAIQISAIESTAAYVAGELGYANLKELQLKVIVDFVSGRDVFAIVPEKACAMVLAWNLRQDCFRARSYSYSLGCHAIDRRPGMYCCLSMY